MSRSGDGEVRLRKVVIGIDFSAHSLAAAGWTRRHFAPEAECVLVHALDVPRPPRFLAGSSAAREEVLRSARAGAVSRLQRLAVGEGWGDVAIDVRDGRSEEVLAAAAAERAADVAVVGEHAHRRGIWSTLGSTAEALVRTSPVPVLLARSGADHAPRRILVAVDDSDHARAALGWTRVLARRFEAEVTACHVFRPVFIGAARNVSGMQASTELEREQREQTRAWLEQLMGEADVAGAVLRIEQGDPVASLVAAQRSGDIDLMVIGSRGAGGAGRMLLGSVADGVLRGASCPVLVVSA